MNTRRRPVTSPMRPTLIRARRRGQVRSVRHSAWVIPMWRSRMIDGIATLTIVASTMIIATPIVSATRPSQRLRSFVAGVRRSSCAIRSPPARHAAGGGHPATTRRRAAESGRFTSEARRSCLRGSRARRCRADPARGRAPPRPGRRGVRCATTRRTTGSRAAGRCGLVAGAERLLAEEVADRVDRESHVLEEEDPDEAGPDHRLDAPLPASADEVAGEERETERQRDPEQVEAVDRPHEPVVVQVAPYSTPRSRPLVENSQPTCECHRPRMCSARSRRGLRGGSAGRRAGRRARGACGGR